MIQSIPPLWQEALHDTVASTEFQYTLLCAAKAYTLHPDETYPPADRLFAALEAAAPEDVRVVIIGQDPYHGPGQADGLAFSVQPGVKFPPSLRNILKEVDAETGCGIPENGCLQRWADQGVLLLNNTLSVHRGSPLSHSSFGWQRLTDAVVEYLSTHHANIVFMLWGGDAQKKRALIDESKHLVLCAVHPSPLSAYRGFFGCGHFRSANEYLTAHNRTCIKW